MTIVNTFLFDKSVVTTAPYLLVSRFVRYVKHQVANFGEQVLMIIEGTDRIIGREKSGMSDVKEATWNRVPVSYVLTSDHAK